MVKTIDGIWEPHIEKLKVADKQIKEIPVFCLTYDLKGLCSVDLYAWPHKGFMSFKDKRGDNELIIENEEELKKQIEKYGYASPPEYVKEIFKDIRKAKNLASLMKKQLFIDECRDLGKKWKKYLK